MEALCINRPLDNLSGDIKYRVHVRNIGWQEWKSNGDQAGTIGQVLPIEAIEIRLTGKLATKYNVIYCMHIANIGWQEWVSNGTIPGTLEQALQTEAVRIKLAEKS
ncbi:MAG: hypothetical protein HUJ51_05965 [Eggerthellaceae bacterium]|nr:hypothetical protein [Eggerthellaceae bacterium]